MHNAPQFQPAPPTRSLIGDVALGVFLGLWLFAITAVAIGYLILVLGGRSITTSS